MSRNRLPNTLPTAPVQLDLNAPGAVDKLFYASENQRQGRWSDRLRPLPNRWAPQPRPTPPLQRARGLAAKVGGVAGCG